MSGHIDIVFDGPPSHQSGRFVEVEDAAGKSIRYGEWLQRHDGFWVLRAPSPDCAALLKVIDQADAIIASIAAQRPWAHIREQLDQYDALRKAARVAERDARSGRAWPDRGSGYRRPPGKPR